jgi:hypothetical protein
LTEAESHAGGGGERVLWTAIAHMDPDIVSVVYTGDTEASKQEIIAKVKVSSRSVQYMLTGNFLSE